MALDRWIALILLGICMVYGYTAWFTMDAGLAPFMQRNPIWPSTFPKVLSILAIGACLVIVFGIEKSEIKEAEIDYRRLHEYKLGQAVMLLGLMVAYALCLRPVGFIFSTSAFLILGSFILGERKWVLMISVAFIATMIVWYLVQEVLGIYMRPLPGILEVDMLEGLLIGLQTAMSLQNLLMVIAGCLIGTFIGMLPGLGPMSIIAIMIPIAISMGDPSAALILLAGVYYGAIFGGSTSSILLNAPGVAGTVASSFDGYPMAKQGKAGKALTIAAVSSFAGGTIGAILLMVFAPMLSSVALLFHSAEYFALMVVGLSAIAAFAGTGQVAKALLMTLLGLIMATVGEGALFNLPRFTAGIMDLQSGFGFITLAMAMFALPEAMFLVLKPKDVGNTDGEIKDLRINGSEARAIAPVIGRQSIQGFFIGVLPGAGATIASFLGYAVERNLATKEEQAEFGKGAIKGLAAPETANNAACTGSFVPLLTLGIPGSGTTAILLGALLALNVSPGPRLMVDEPQIFWAVIMSMFIGNLVLLILNLPLIPYIAKVLSIPRNFLIPFILFFTLMGAYIGQNNATELLILVGFGVCATALKFADYPLAPLLIGFILGGMLENNFARSMQLYDGVSFIWERPMTLGLLVIAALLVVLPSYRARRAKLRAEGIADGD